MELIESSDVIAQINSYPTVAKERLLTLRRLIIDTAKESEQVTKLVETKKWGEPSYVSKTGSTLRMDWKKDKPGKCFLFFTCTTELVPTFRVLFGDDLQFEGSRAIELSLEDPIPTDLVRRCILMTLTYHRIKHFPLLGQ